MILKKVVCFLCWRASACSILSTELLVYNILGKMIEIYIYKDLQVIRPFKRFHKISKHFKNTES